MFMWVLKEKYFGALNSDIGKFLSMFGTRGYGNLLFLLQILWNLNIEDAFEEKLAS